MKNVAKRVYYYCMSERIYVKPISQEKAVKNAQKIEIPFYEIPKMEKKANALNEIRVNGCNGAFDGKSLVEH